MPITKRCLMLCLSIAFLLTGCSSPNHKEPPSKKGTRDNTPYVLQPQASGEKTIGNSKITFDLSHSEDGYTMVEYHGHNSKVKVRIQNPDSQEFYTYDIHEGYNTFPLTGGSGSYTFIAYENISGTKYSQLFLKEENIQIQNDYISYLYPNQYVSFDKNTQAISLAQEIVVGANNDLEAVSYVYDYVIEHISYDDEKATLAKEGKMAGYLPDVDETLQTKTGICFDYAALMATMLRTQNIPTRMELGYVTMEDETIYHAWISVYIHDIGWIDDLIHFDGKNWSMMDPTLISDGHNSSKVRSLIKDQKNYTTKYLY